MTSQEAWLKIVAHLQTKSIEFPTVPKIKRDPVWFEASTDDEIIMINPAKINRPSSQLTMQRKLSYEIFEKVYPIYLRRINGEAVSNEALRTTVNQVYYFSLIKHCCNL